MQLARAPPRDVRGAAACHVAPVLLLVYQVEESRSDLAAVTATASRTVERWACVILIDWESDRSDHELTFLVSPTAALF